MYKIYGAILISFLIVVFLTPYVKKLAIRLKAVDVPKSARKIHHTTMPRMGGLAIFIAFVFCVVIFIPLRKEVIGLLLGSTFIVAMGILDDIKELSSKVKLAGQVVAAVILYASGVKIEWLTSPFGGMLYMGHFSFFLTVFWIVGITNTINFIDGLDGLASGVSSIISFTILVIAIRDGNHAVALMMAAVMGGTLGFLPYNFNPAKIFMGDTGSLFLGYILAGVSVMGAYKNATILLTFSIFALGLPIFDTAFAIIRRFVHGKPIMEADRGHMHHRLLDMGFSQRQAVVILYLISASFGVIAILLDYLDQSRVWTMIASGLFLIFVIIIIYVLIAKNTKKYEMDADK